MQPSLPRIGVLIKVEPCNLQEFQFSCKFLSPRILGFLISPCGRLQVFLAPYDKNKISTHVWDHIWLALRMNERGSKYYLSASIGQQFTVILSIRTFYLKKKILKIINVDFWACPINLSSTLKSKFDPIGFSFPSCMRCISFAIASSLIACWLRVTQEFLGINLLTKERFSQLMELGGSVGQLQLPYIEDSLPSDIKLLSVRIIDDGPDRLLNNYYVL